MTTFISIASLLALFVIVLYTIHSSDKRENELMNGFQSERALWALERKELIDRIQAGSYAELKQQEVRVIKAQKKEEASPINYSHLE